jgi:DNA polymerase elongation subunit (family B)
MKLHKDHRILQPMSYSFRLFDFNVYNDEIVVENNNNYHDDYNDREYTKGNSKSCDKQFKVQMFGMDEVGVKYSVIAEGYKPFFYVLVDERWTAAMKDEFVLHLNKTVSQHENAIDTSLLIRKKKLYGFDGGKYYKFLKFEFLNTIAMNKIKNLWYKKVDTEYELIPGGYLYRSQKKQISTYIKIYESVIPPLLRLFHIREISPSGWVEIPKQQSWLLHNQDEEQEEMDTVAFLIQKRSNRSCKYEIVTNYKNIYKLNKETRVPLKIMSMDIEASSSHGDFPLPIKTYKKLATNVIDAFEEITQTSTISVEECYTHLEEMMLTAFGFADRDNIDLVYPKEEKRNRELLHTKIKKTIHITSAFFANHVSQRNRIQDLFEKVHNEYNNHLKDDTDAHADADADEEDNNDDHENIEEAEDTDLGDEKEYIYVEEINLKEEDCHNANIIPSQSTLIKIILDPTLARQDKIDAICTIFDSHLPLLKGDMVTFIGSTFMTYGDSKPHKNHCIALRAPRNSGRSEEERGCDSFQVNDTETIIQNCETEKDVLLAWQRLVQEEDPDVIIGYNIFGFDYEFMFRRAQENNCVQEFLQLSRNEGEICGNRLRDKRGYLTNEYDIENSSISIASGQHQLRYIKMNGRIQVDLYNYYRRQEKLTSFKLDNVAGHFIKDDVFSLEHNHDANETIIQSKNLTGLTRESYIHIEEIGHSTNYYEGGRKFLVTSIDAAKGSFTIRGIITPVISAKKVVQWSISKDDVTPKEIFSLSNGDSSDRAIIAKYCIQDCNLVQSLFFKSDILTGYIEMSSICSVPINFLVMRGQGIKLTSLVFQKCRERDTLIEVRQKGKFNEGYEGATVLTPKTGMYLKTPLATLDYGSLYPSCMISENISHDSKCLTKEYNLKGELIHVEGEQDENGVFIYDHLPQYEYVDIQSNTYTYIRKSPKSKAIKTLTGTKVCRFSQFPNNESAIMPSILKELLQARKSTRKKGKLEKDAFMKQVLEQRQLGYKLTANSLYGQCGAQTSTFYEKDIAASTTATGRMMLMYAVRVVTEVYKDKVCMTKNYGEVVTHPECIYGDTDSVFFAFHLKTLSGENIEGQIALEITIELAQELSALASSFLKQPHDLEYEKTFLPFVIPNKKRYVGILFELNPHKGKRKEMGIELKRTDNSSILRDCLGGVIDIIMIEKDIMKAVGFLQQCLQDLLNETIPMSKLIITKSFRNGYKNPSQVPQAVLAKRITDRNEGNKPAPGDRIPYVFICNPNKKAKQGDRIETPTFITENNIKIDYTYYITNQIMRPLQQFLGLALTHIWKEQKKLAKIKRFEEEVRSLRQKTPAEKFDREYKKKVNAEIKKLIFEPFLREANNRSEGCQTIQSMFLKQLHQSL